MEFAPRGSSIYYSLLNTPSPQREFILAIREFHSELTNIIFHCQEKSVALQKIHWWREELNALAQGKPHHPITQALQAAHLPPQGLQTILAGVIDDFHITMYEKEEKLQEYYENTAGMAEELIAHICDIRNPAAIKVFRDIGVFCQRVLDLRDIRKTINHGHIFISGEMLMKHNVTLFQLNNKELTFEIKALFKTLTDNLLAYQPGQCKKTPGFILYQLRRALLQEIIDANFPIMRQRIDLTPIRKWWIAWKK